MEMQRTANQILKDSTYKLPNLPSLLWKKMMKTILLLAVYIAVCKAEYGPMWGSRILLSSNAAGYSQHYVFPSPSTIYLSPNDDRILTVVEGKCMEGPIEIGSPCTLTPESADIVIKDPSKYTIMRIVSGSVLNSTTFFVQSCTDKTPSAGKIVLSDSIPLSRFDDGSRKYHINFTIGTPAESIKLFKDKDVYCTWTNGAVGETNPGSCDNLGNSPATMYTFDKQFDVGTDTGRHTFKLEVGTEQMVFSFDLSSPGVSTEMDICGGKYTTTTSTTSSASESTTSSSNKLEALVEAILGTIVTSSVFHF